MLENGTKAPDFTLKDKDGKILQTKSNKNRKVEFDEIQFIKPGSYTFYISEKVEEDLVNSNIELKADVLKVAHHGSKTSSSEDFLKAVSPQISVVSVGTSDDTLPDYETMVRINHYSDSLYRTDKDKTIIITSNGNKLKIQTNA